MTTALPSVAEHPLYAALTGPAELRTFMRSHVFAVWDFQCLLKTLQQRLTSVGSPWLPTDDLASRRLINEIVLEEESDVHPTRGHASHFELYLDAMADAGADTGPIEALIAGIRAGGEPRELLAAGSWPPGVARFVTWTLDVIATGELHRIAAAFTQGREEVIPAMFQELVAQLDERDAKAWGLFRFYLERHIELDGGDHGPAARKLFTRLHQGDARLEAEAMDTAREALSERCILWDSVRAAL
ncbi:MAG: DUF3050 domain-containing protein [Planctomycetota bacterium]|nr:DUF3050 domain-containing protein [Planctomycetota bacterium]